MNSSRLLNSQEARQFLGGISPVTLYRRQQQPDFPPPLKIQGRNYWRLRDLEAWIDRQAEGVADG